MREVAGILRSMGPEQLLMALIFLGCYALALGEFATPRGGPIALAPAWLPRSSSPRSAARGPAASS